MRQPASDSCRTGRWRRGTRILLIQLCKTHAVRALLLRSTTIAGGGKRFQSVRMVFARYPSGGNEAKPIQTTSMYRCIAIVITSSVLATVAHADSPDIRALAASCATCHQPALHVPPSLAGQPREKIASKLHGFRNGSLHGTVMPQIAKGYTIDELDALADYFAQAREP